MDYLAIHEKWQKFWRENNTNKFDANSKKPKYYCLEMFPYPSGATLHMGHFYSYSLPDTHARFMRMSGYNVFHPFGFDAFGLPAENHALKSKTHPHDNTVKNMQVFRDQVEKLGGMYDWDYMLTTCFPDYYKWTQWLFLKLFEAGMAYQKEAPVNWCDKCKTVLANEQVISGECERCSTMTEKRNLKQWFFKITDYADSLLDGLDGLDWPNKTKTMQRNWIGKHTGAKIKFELVKDAKNYLEVFTTRPDTLMGATFMVIAPEHALVNSLITPENKKACETYIKQASKKQEVERLCENREKTGVFTGSYAKNPLSCQDIPIYIADYVLAGYGTGAIMAVPAHDERDHAFATKYNLPIIHVVDEELESSKQEIVKKLEDEKMGERATTYRLRDWSIGRQRYWGVPIPIIYCDSCGVVPVPESDLPVKLPYIQDFAPKGQAPLANVADFVNTKCPKCGANARREVDTMDTFVCSSWYFLRFPDSKDDTRPFDPKSKLLPVDKYIGGAEHACMHLLYARFINHFLYNKKLVPFKEPFTSLIHQGMVLASDGSKMSKSKGNVISPDDYVSKYGSDVLRLFMLFGFNFVDGGPWNDGTLKTVMRFTERIERAVVDNQDTQETDSEVLYTMANTIKSVREDLRNFSFNTAVARCMELLNAIYKAKITTRESVRTLVLLVAPMVPHLAEEFWAMLGEKPSVFAQDFPTADEKYLVRDTVEVAVQVNSKIITRIVVSSAETESEVAKIALKDAKISTLIPQNRYKKVVFIPGRLINFIV